MCAVIQRNLRKDGVWPDRALEASVEKSPKGSRNCLRRPVDPARSIEPFLLLRMVVLECILHLSLWMLKLCNHPV